PERPQAGSADAREHPDQTTEADPEAAAGALPRRRLRQQRGARPLRGVRVHRPHPRPRRRSASAQTRGRLPRPPLGRRTHPLLAQPLPPHPHSLGEARRHLPRHAPPRLRPDHLASHRLGAPIGIGSKPPRRSAREVCMEFRILGPLEVIADGKPVELGAPKQRALLALLLLQANRVVSSDRLIDALWDEGAPETAQKALQVYVSQLRKLLARYRSGRQADALDAYQAARTAFVDELGIEPGRQLRELHQAILNQDAGLDLAGTEPADPPASSPPPPAAEPAPRESRKTVSVLLAALSAPEGLDPETLRRLTGGALAEITAAVERHG